MFNGKKNNTSLKFLILKPYKSLLFCISLLNSIYSGPKIQGFTNTFKFLIKVMPAHEFSLDERSPSAALKQPSEISSYSIDTQRQLHVDSTQELRYFYFPETLLPECYDLNQGHSSWVKKIVPAGGAHLDEMLTALLHYERELNSGKKVKGDFVTYRGVMTKLLTLPFDHEGEDIDINVMAFDKQVFMELDHELLEAKRAEREIEQQQRQQKQYGDTGSNVDMSYWGYKFEALATLPRPWSQCTRQEIELRPRAIIDNNSEYCVLVTTGVGKTRVVLGAEVDAVYDYKPASRADYKTDRPLDHYIELKTTRVVDSPRSARTFERKLLRSWAQSFLIGVPRVFYAFRDGPGIVRSQQEFQTAEIPKLVHNSTVSGGGSPAWNGNECVAFYAAVLEWIKSVVLAGSDEDFTPWRLQFLRGNRSLSLYKLQGAEAEKVKTTLILPEFVEWRQSRPKRQNK